MVAFVTHLVQEAVRALSGRDVRVRLVAEQLVATTEQDDKHAERKPHDGVHDAVRQRVEGVSAVGEVPVAWGFMTHPSDCRLVET